MKKLTTPEEIKEFMDSIDPLDEFGFHKKMGPEAVGNEIERLELNLAYYREFMKNKSKFPKWVHDQRAEEFHRLREIRQPIEYGLNDAQQARLRE